MPKVGQFDNVKNNTCKHCNKEFNVKLSEFANHVRWCDQNPNRNDSIPNIKKSRVEAIETRCGPLEGFEKLCENCGNLFQFFSRKNSTHYKNYRFCTKKCSRSFSASHEWHVSEKKSHYAHICFIHHPKECAICGYERCVHVHHNDHNHDNDEPENLIPLCPNHHSEIHMKQYRDEVQLLIDEYILKFKRTNSRS